MSDGAEEVIVEHAGFPNPATDTSLQALDLNQLLVARPVSTYYMRLDSNQWEGQGMYRGDLVLVDRALEPRAVDYVIWWQDEAFVISKRSKMPKGTTVWGTVTTVIHRYMS